MRRIVIGLAILSFALLTPAIASADDALDNKIADQIISQLNRQKKAGKLRGFRIDLQVKGATVHMKGRVSTVAQRKMALQIAARIEGVKQVVNEMSVKAVTRKPAKKKAKQSSIPNLFFGGFGLTRLKPTKKKTTKLQTSRRSARAVKTVAARKVTKKKPALRKPAVLKPAARKAAIRKAAIRKPAIRKPVIRKAERRQPVIKKLSSQPVAADHKVIDRRIASQIIAQLSARKQSGELRNFKLDVHVDRGVVWVKGRVASRASQFMVLDISRRVRGVAKVVNDLAIRGQSLAPIAPVSAQQQPPTSRRTEAPRPLAGPVGTGPLGGRSLVPQMPQVRQPLQRPLQQLPPQQRLGYRYPLPVAPSYSAQAAAARGPRPMPGYRPDREHASRARYDHPTMPRHAWPSYASYPNYAAVTYPRQYSPTAWPYMGPFYPYPQVPLGWRKVTLEWDDGWWMLDFNSR